MTQRFFSFSQLLPLIAMVGLLVSMSPTSALAADQAHWTKANSAIDRGIEYLRAAQNDDGSWTPQPGPAITALVVAAMLDQPDISPSDPAVAKGIDYILKHVNEDGSIHGGILANYNTSISVSALSRVHNNAAAADAIKNAQDYLRSLQWSDQQTPDGEAVDESHPYFGGAGYGKHGRPDMSNTHFMIQALYDSGLDCNDPAFIRAMVFISRCQGTEANDLFKDKIQQDGGFIYATSINKDLVGVPESKANPEMMDEALQGKPVSNLRTYGSMTYAGFKSYIYANLQRDDPRVQDALKWIQHHYTLERNPGMPESRDQQGLFYYYMVFARALRAWNEPVVSTGDAQHNWSHDLIDKVASLQREDGSWTNEADRWMEGDPNLVTAYALLALTDAIR